MRRRLSISDLPSPPDRFLAGRLDAVRRLTAQAAARAGRDPSGIEILPVTKYVTADVVRTLHEIGVRDFGESRIQEIEEKRRPLSDLAGLRIHMIGHLQRNKARKAVSTCASIHSVDSERLLREIDARCAEVGGDAPDLLVEVNISREPQKSGVSPDELGDLLRVARELPVAGPAIRGLMGMARHSGDPEETRPAFRLLRELRDEMVSTGLLRAPGDLSMGMSGDFPVAIEEGATWIRVGSILFEPGDPEAPDLPEGPGRPGESGESGESGEGGR